MVFTRTLSELPADKGIRVNGVAPGPIWTPLIPASFPEEKVSKLGSNVPPARSTEPDEVAPLLCFSRLGDSSFTTSQFLHPNGGKVVNGQMLKHRCHEYGPFVQDAVVTGIVVHGLPPYFMIEEASKDEA